MVTIQLGDTQSISKSTCIAAFVAADGPASGDVIFQSVQTAFSAFTDTALWRVKSGTSVTSIIEIESNRLPVIGIGMGSLSSVSIQNLRDWAATAAKSVQTDAAVSWIVPVLPHLNPQSVANAMAEGIVLGSYQFDRFKAEAQRHQVHHYLISSEALSATAIDQAVHGAEATNMARDLANMPPNILTPWYVVELVQQTFSGNPNVVIDVIDVQRATELGMGAFLGVAQGASVPPAILVLRYQPFQNDKPIVLIGKGVTFDSGGISIKPGRGMSDMKGDMSGAAAVLAAFTAAVRLNLGKAITAVIPMTENMPDGAAQRPGDIVTAMNGKTIEIINTDAEGRLILADALVYAAQYENPKVMVDIATLTGACSVALGDLAAGVLGNNQSTIDQLLAAGHRTGEQLWQLPLFDGYLAYLKSDYADIANASEAGKAGTSTGAKFLQQFVGEVPWVHLDIASVMKGNGKGIQPKGMSGAGARLLLDWLSVDA